MAWIESHTVLMRHRKVAELARVLRIRRSHLIGHLHALWHAALEQQDNGDLSAWTDEFIAEQSDYPGDAPQYVRQLQDHGFLGYIDKSGSVIPGTEKLIHDWIDYAGTFLKGRYSTKKERIAEIHDLHDASKLLRSKSGVNGDKLSLPTKPTVPTAPTSGADDLDDEIRNYLRDHPTILWDQKTHNDIKAMVKEAGWSDTKSAMDEALANAAARPAAYAKTIVSARKARQALGPAKPARAVPTSAIAHRKDN